jgi:hypothetical protein
MPGLEKTKSRESNLSFLADRAAASNKVAYWDGCAGLAAEKCRNRHGERVTTAASARVSTKAANRPYARGKGVE